MHPGSHSFWASVISPFLRTLVPGVTTSISPVFIEYVPLADAGDFMWTLVCISQWTPHELLQAYRIDAATPPAHICTALIESACQSTDFYGYPTGELIRLLRRLEVNTGRLDVSESERQAHQVALNRIYHVIAYVAAAHPAADEWVRQSAKPSTGGSKPRSAPLKLRPKGPRPSHLKLVGG